MCAARGRAKSQGERRAHLARRPPRIDKEHYQQQAQESEKWVMLGQGEESDGTPPKGGEERDAEMSGEAVSREKRDRAEEADKREDPEGDENMRTEEEVAQAGKKKRQGNSPETEK